MKNIAGRGWVAGTILALSLGQSSTADEAAVTLRERFSVGYQYHVSTRVDLCGSLKLPAEKDKPAPKPLAVVGDSAIEYDERVLALTDSGEVRKTMRILQRMDFHRSMGGRGQSGALRREVRRLVLIRHKQTEVPFSPDGPLTWGEIDLVRTDVFTPALAGMLPDKAVRPGDTWSATIGAVQELTDLEKIDEGGLQCKLEQVARRDGRRLARVSFQGTITGSGEDGRNRQKLEGYLDFDLEGNYLRYLYLKGAHTLLDGDGKEVGKVEGRFVLSRQANTRSPDLTDEKLKGLALEPNADNTLLLYDNPDLGVRFVHPRRWKVAGVRGSQVTLDSADGGGLLITLDPLTKVPSGEQFLIELRDWLLGQKAKVLKTVAVQQVQTKPSLEHFALEADMGGQKFLMDYHVARQTRGGATLAARLLPPDTKSLQEEVARIARSLVITREIRDRK